MRVIRTLLSFAFVLITNDLALALEYEKDIMPIFKKKCFECHSDEADKVKGGLRLDDPAHFHGRFNKDELVNPGEPKMSNLYYGLTRPRYDDGAMPPEKKGKQLTEEEIKLVRNWILEGAPINGERGKRGKMPEEEKEPSKTLPARAVEEEWVNQEGKIIVATFLRIDGEVVLLRIKGGKVFRYPIAKLSEKSQAALKKIAP